MRSKIYLYRLAQWLNSRLPSRAAGWLAEQLADFQWRGSSLDRAAVRFNLTLVLGSPIEERSPLVREVFRNFARYLVEFLSAHRLREPSVALEGDEHLAQTFRANRGSIILSAHIGNWELGAMVFHRLGVPISIVVLPHQDPRVNQFFDHQRLRCGVDIVPLNGQATQRCLELLREGRSLGILGDREFGHHGVAVSFFGRQATVPRGPAILSLRTHAPVVPVFLIREGLWRFRLYIEPPIWPPERPYTEATVLALTQTYVTVIERYIRRFPSQWLMFQPLLGEPIRESANCELPIAD